MSTDVSEFSDGLGFGVYSKDLNLSIARSLPDHCSDIFIPKCFYANLYFVYQQHSKWKGLNKFYRSKFNDYKCFCFFKRI